MRAVLCKQLCKFEQQLMLFFSFMVLFGSVELATANAPSIEGKPVAKQEDYTAYVKKISSLMAAHIYDPRELKRDEYLQIENKLAEVAQHATDKQSFVDGFNELWYGGPFSHVRIAITDKNAEQTAEFLDNMRVGGKGADLRWEGDVAIMTVRTMMGADTIEQINHYYEEIDQKKASVLIIDLRENNGGAFAVNPLVSHLLASPLDAGSFTSRKWASKNKGGPSEDDVKNVTPWEGWSIRSFWNDVQSVALTRVRMQPTQPYFGGKVYVLTSKQTASAAEMAADALHNLPNVTVIGETTAGEMLSQKMFDLADTLQLMLPVADYYSSRVGRIEGVGVVPDIETQAGQAMDEAFIQIKALALVK